MREERIMVDRRGSQWKKYFGYGLTAFLVIAAAVLLVFVFVRKEDFSDLTGSIGKALAPVVMGAVFAYIMNPLMVFFEERLKLFFYKHSKRISKANRSARSVSIIITLIVVLLLIGFLIYLLVPQLVSTITDIINNRYEMVDNVENWYYGLELEDTKAGEYLEVGFQKATDYVNDFVDNKLVDTVTNVLGSVAVGVKNVLGTLYNVLLGLIFSIYILSAKEKLAAISKKILYATFKRRTSNKLLRITRACHTKFTGAITGKIVDSIIIGLICFVAMLIFDIPYPTLVSVVVGVTNVIPFFGPFIGAIPSAILIFFASPVKCLYFLIMILVLQQFDGNVLTPKIVGNTIGLSPLWVLFACTVFGSLWGVVGMLIGVPLMASIYMIIKEIVEDKLHYKGLETDTDYYQTLDYVNETEMFCRVIDTEAEAARDAIEAEMKAEIEAKASAEVRGDEAETKTEAKASAEGGTDETKK